MHTLILPFIEQNNLYDTVHLDYSVNDPNNWLPNYAKIFGVKGNASISVDIRTFICPSTPSHQVDYEPYFISLGLPDEGPFPLGGTDYAVVQGYTKYFNAPPNQGLPTCAPGSPFSTNGIFADDKEGALGRLGHKLPGGMKQATKIADIKDGLSNTIMVGEDAGRHQNWAKGSPYTSPPPSPYNYWDGPNGWMLNAAWADYNSAIRIAGFSADGKTPAGGCCVVNCNNAWQLYSFHPGGVNTLRGDGSVQFMQESIAPGVLAALVTRAAGEIFNED